jgi:hypothetical protein
MRSRALPTVAAAALVCLAAAGPASGASTPSAAETCSSITEGASGNAQAACLQGYAGATLKATLPLVCLTGVKAIEVAENEHDCKAGFIYAGGVAKAAPAANSAAEAACASVTEGAADESPAACEQGYQDALAGLKQEASCYHIGAGAITAIEYVNACEAGWFLAKKEATCIPGVDSMNGQPETTVESDPATDKTCSTPA